MKRRSWLGLQGLFPWLLVILCVAPHCYVLLRSFLKTDGVTFQYYYDVFFRTPQYLLRFWKSLLLSCCIAAGQVVVSVLAGYGFAKCRFKGRGVLVFFLLELMILPLQVTLVPNYIVLDHLNLLNTYYALALPTIFVPLGTFIMLQRFKATPNEVLEAAQLDGCGLFATLIQIAIPMNKSGLVCTMLLSFLDSWNMVEQPVAYLNEIERYPISVALASVPSREPTTQLVCCVLVALPALFLFAYFSKDLVEGIAFANGEMK